MAVNLHHEYHMRGPKGSILGLLLFVIYVNDMVRVISCDLYLYADDSALLVSGKDILRY